MNKYENLCASHLQSGVYVEECDYGEVKLEQSRKDSVPYSKSSEDKEIQVSHTIRVELVDVNKKAHNSQSQTISYQHSLSPESTLSVKENNSRSKRAKHENAASKRVQARKYDVDKEEYDDTVHPHNKTKPKRLPHHPCHLEAERDHVINRSHGQKARGCTALQQSSTDTAATSVRTGYQPLLRRKRDYENSSLQGYESMIKTSKSQNSNRSDDDYDYVLTTPKYYYRPSVK